VEGPRPSVAVRRTVLEAVIAHAREALPDECCGLLLGSAARIEAAHPARNLRPSPTRFLIDPQDHFDALRAGRATGTAVVGAYHSHPASTGIPSRADRAEASYSEYLYVIVGLVEPVDVRAWVLDAGNFQEVALVSVA
jgi:proteasome lid subunit RPN8/RPN11